MVALKPPEFDQSDPDSGPAAASGMRDAAKSRPPLPLGTRVQGRYELVERLGAGGMGYVYGGVDTRLQRPVAIKIVRSDLASDTNLAARFEREALAASRLAHANVVVVHDFGKTVDGTPFLVMERLFGNTLKKVLRRGASLPVEQALRVARDVTAALIAAHDAGIVHRDLKPDNIFLCDDGRAKVLDFGIAKIVSGGEGFRSSSLTQTGSMLGTPLYMSPEAVMANGTVGPPSDIYALGTLLFRMLTGRPPFQNDEPVVVLSMHVQQPPPRLTAVAPALVLPPGLEAFVEEILDKRPSARPSARAAESRLSALASLAAAEVSPARSPAVAEVPTAAPVPVSAPAQAAVAPPPGLLFDEHHEDATAPNALEGFAFRPSRPRRSPLPAEPQGALESSPPLPPSRDSTPSIPPSIPPEADGAGVLPVDGALSPEGRPSTPELSALESASRAPDVPHHSARFMLAAGATSALIVLASIVWVIVAFGGEEGSPPPRTGLPAQLNVGDGTATDAPRDELPSTSGVELPEVAEANHAVVAADEARVEMPEVGPPEADRAPGVADEAGGEMPELGVDEPPPEVEPTEQEPVDPGDPVGPAEASAEAEPRLQLRSDRPARVTVDGEPRGETPVSLRLTPGRHEVELESRGTRRRLLIDARPGEVVRRRVRFERRAAPGSRPADRGIVLPNRW